MLLYRNGNECLTVQGKREEITKCSDCNQKGKEDCTSKLLTQKINENVKRINEIFNFKKSRDRH